ncbi:uncharacterized protein V6R79_014223 [Siganus canaliculatus]
MHPCRSAHCCRNSMTALFAVTLLNQDKVFHSFNGARAMKLDKRECERREEERERERDEAEQENVAVIAVNHRKATSALAVLASATGWNSGPFDVLLLLLGDVCAALFCRSFDMLQQGLRVSVQSFASISLPAAPDIDSNTASATANYDLKDMFSNQEHLVLTSMKGF